ncbi:MAG TPA: sortase [Acidimicrobiales bacterium]|nr:sortase [Acidimicrobiales bacterium]
MGRGAPAGRWRVWRRIVAELGYALVTAGVVLLAFVAYDLWGTSLSESHAQAVLARQFHAALAAPGHLVQPARRVLTGGLKSKTTGSDSPTVGSHSPTVGSHSPTVGSQAGRALVATGTLPVPPSGVALDRIVIPAIGVDRYVVQGVAEADLQMGPGHYPGTPMPGQRGNVGIAGHRTTFGAPFFELGQLVNGDMVYITDTTGWTWGYRVERLFSVAPTDVAVLAPSPHAELTLTTCTPPFEATQRLVVRAELAGGAPPGTAVTGLPKRLAHGRSDLLIANPGPGGALPSKPGGAGPSRVSKAAGIAKSTGAARASPSAPTRAVPVASNENAAAGAVLWGAGAAAIWVLARISASLWLPRRGARERWSPRRARCSQAGVILLGAAVACVPLWSCFANVVQLLPANF